MAKEEGKITVEGTVIEALPATQFKVKLDNDHEVLAYLSGKMRIFASCLGIASGSRCHLTIYLGDESFIARRNTHPCLLRLSRPLTF